MQAKYAIIRDCTFRETAKYLYETGGDTARLCHINFFSSSQVLSISSDSLLKHSKASPLPSIHYIGWAKGKGSLCFCVYVAIAA